jgi:hypothetical protein
MSTENRTETASAGRTYELLRHPVRRRVLFELGRREAPVTPATLAAASDGDDGGDEGHGDGSEAGADTTTLIELRHSHLPKLVSAGWIEREGEGDGGSERDGTVRYGANPERVRAALGLASDEVDRLRSAVGPDTAGA